MEQGTVKKWKRMLAVLLVVTIGTYVWNKGGQVWQSLAYLVGYYVVLALGLYGGAGAGAIAGTAAGVALTLLTQHPEQVGVFAVAGLAVGFFGQLGAAVGSLSFVAAALGGSIMYAPALSNDFFWEMIFSLGLLVLLHPLWQRFAQRSSVKRQRRGNSIYASNALGIIGSMSTREDTAAFGKRHYKTVVCEQWLEDYAQHLKRISGSFRTMPVLSDVFLQLSGVLEEVSTGDPIQLLDGIQDGSLNQTGSLGRTNKSRTRSSFSVAEELHRISGPVLSATFGAAKCAKEGETTSGDQFSCIRLPGQRLMLGICDGMGSGRRASEDSQRIIELLEHLVEAGLLLRTSVKLIHTMMLYEQNEDVSVSLDVATVDMVRGDCEMTKAGAAASFIRRKNSVEMIQAESLPIGILPECNPTESCFRLRAGDLCVMVSDGVLEAIAAVEKEEAMAGFLSGLPEDLTAQEYAQRILDFALAGGPAEDDMLVLTLLMDE